MDGRAHGTAHPASTLAMVQPAPTAPTSDAARYVHERHALLVLHSCAHAAAVATVLLTCPSARESGVPARVWSLSTRSGSWNISETLLACTGLLFDTVLEHTMHMSQSTPPSTARQRASPQHSANTQCPRLSMGKTDEQSPASHPMCNTNPHEDLHDCNDHTCQGSELDFPVPIHCKISNQTKVRIFFTSTLTTCSLWNSKLITIESLILASLTHMVKAIAGRLEAPRSCAFIAEKPNSDRSTEVEGKSKTSRRLTGCDPWYCNADTPSLAAIPMPHKYHP